MRTLTVQVDDTTAQMIQALPSKAQSILTNGALSALLSGELYPTGTNQLDLAIALAEAGVAPETISRLTRLDFEAFEAFLRK